MTAQPDPPVPPATPQSSWAPAPAPAPAPARRDRGTQILFLVAGLIAVAGVAFAVGRVSAPTPVAAASGRAFGNGGLGGFGNGAPNASAAAGAGLGRGIFGGAAGAGGGAAVRGTVESVTSGAITIKLANGSTATVDLSGTTTFHKQAPATSTDVAPGRQVQVEVQFQPRASGASPGPSGAPRTFSASDITIVAP